MKNNDCYSGYIQWSAWGTHHCNQVILIRKRTIRAHVVVVILNVISWLSGVLCYHGYKPTCAQQAPLWEGLWRQGCSSREEEGGTWELYHSNVLAKSTFFSKLQTAALSWAVHLFIHSIFVDHWHVQTFSFLFLAFFLLFQHKKARTWLNRVLEVPAVLHHIGTAIQPKVQEQTLLSTNVNPWNALSIYICNQQLKSIVKRSEKQVANLNRIYPELVFNWKQPVFDTRMWAVSTKTD